MDDPADPEPVHVQQGLLLDQGCQDHGFVGGQAQCRGASLQVEVVQHLQKLLVHPDQQAQLVADGRLVQLVGVGEQQALHQLEGQARRVVLPCQPVADQGRPQLILVKDRHLTQQPGHRLLDGQALGNGHPDDLLGQRTQLQGRYRGREREVLLEHVFTGLE